MKLTDHTRALFPKLHLVAETPADEVLLRRFKDTLSGDPAVRLTLLLDLLERHEATEPVRGERRAS